MKCPLCESGDGYLCSVAYKQGTTTVDIDTDISGYSVGSDGSTAQHQGGGSHTTTRRTAFARDAAPSSRPGQGLVLYMLVALAANVIAVFATSYMYPRAGGQLYLIWRYGEPAWLRWALLLAVAVIAYRIVAGRAKIPA